jgi:hypothetical protein
VTLFTRISSAKKGTKSLKTTIPEGIVEFLELSDKAELEWKMQVHIYERSVTIKKKTVNRVVHEDRLNANNFPFRSVAHNSHGPHNYKNSIHHIKDKPKGSHYISDKRLFNEPKAYAERDDGWRPKIEEIRRLAGPYFQPDVLDEKLRRLSQRVMSGMESEAFVDECLQQLRSKTDTMEAFSRLLTPKPSVPNTSMAEKDPLYNHRRNLRLRQLSEATRFKLAELKQVLESYYHESDSWEIVKDLINKCAITGDNPFLDGILENYKGKAENR